MASVSYPFTNLPYTHELVMPPHYSGINISKTPYSAPFVAILQANPVSGERLAVLDAQLTPQGDGWYQLLSVSARSRPVMVARLIWRVAGWADCCCADCPCQGPWARHPERLRPRDKNRATLAALFIDGEQVAPGHPCAAGNKGQLPPAGRRGPAATRWRWRGGCPHPPA